MRRGSLLTLAIVGAIALLCASLLSAYSEEPVDATLRASAEKLGVNIEGMTLEAAAAAVKRAEEAYNAKQPKLSPEEAERQWVESGARKLGISIEGMTLQEARAAIEKAAAEWEASQPKPSPEEYLKLAAQKLGVDIEGLSLEEAQAAVRRAEDAYNARQSK